MAMDGNEDEDMELVCDEVDLEDGPGNEGSNSACSDDELDPPKLIVPSRDDSCMVLRGHKEGIFCLSVDPLGKYLVSGGQDHIAIVWNLETGDRMFTIEGHEDSVTCIEFTPNGLYLATGDMAGLIRIWLRPPVASDSSHAWTLLHAFSVSDLLWLRWFELVASTTATESDHNPAALIAGDEDGLITMQLINANMNPESKSTRSKVLPGSGIPVTDARLLRRSIGTDRPYLLALYRSAELRLWDLKTSSMMTSLQLPKSSDFQGGAHSYVDGVPDMDIFSLVQPQSSNTIWLKEREVFLVGALGFVYVVLIRSDVIDSTTSDVSFTCKLLANISTTDGGSVEALDFSWTHPYFAFATVNGSLGIVDGVTLKLRRRWTYFGDQSEDDSSEPIGFTRLLWSRTQPLFFTATVNGMVLAWPGLSGSMSNESTGTVAPLRIWLGHCAMVLDLALTPPPPTGTTVSLPGSVKHSSSVVESSLFSSSDDATVRRFSLNNLSPVQ